MKKPFFCYDKGLEVTPHDFLLLYNRSAILYHQGRYEEANISLDKCLKINGNAPMVWNLKALSMIKEKRYEEAFFFSG